MSRSAANKLDDAFGAARSYLHAMRLMVETIFQGKGDDYCAILTVIDSVETEINDAQELCDELQRGGKC